VRQMLATLSGTSAAALTTDLPDPEPGPADH
jgi:hypothetical protein